eukprot:gene15863-24241_t
MAGVALDFAAPTNRENGNVLSPCKPAGGLFEADALLTCQRAKTETLQTSFPKLAKSFPRADGRLLLAGTSSHKESLPSPSEAPLDVDPTFAENQLKHLSTPAETVSIASEAYPPSHRKGMCALILLTRIAAHFDAGALAALYGDSEKRMTTDMKLSTTEQGLLVTLGYVGLIAGCLISGTLLQKFEAKRLLQGSLIILAVGVIAFATAPNKLVLQAARPFAGFGQALLTVLYPVWVDEFAPMGSASTYMAVLQAGGPLGTVAGYLTAGFLMANAGLEWRWVFYIQVMLLSPCVVAFYAIPSHYIDLRPKSGEEPDFLLGIRRVTTDGLVWAATLSLSSLYFVVNGLQTWVTEYINNESTPVEANANTVVAVFGFTAATAPVAGIVVGGVLLARSGGYRGRVDRTALYGLALGTLACCCAWGAVFVPVFSGFMACLWLLLFFGGGMVPGLMGLIVAAVPREYRGMVSAFAAVMYNSLGYALGPLVPGIVADQFDRDDGIKWGFRVVLAWSTVA